MIKKLKPYTFKYFLQALTLAVLFLTSAFACTLQAANQEAVSSNPASDCQKNQDALRDKALHEIYKINSNLAQIYWRSRQSWEVRYNGQWEAVQKKSDPFSDARSTQGEVEAGHVEAQADRLWEESLRGRNSVKKELESLIHLLDSLNACCSAWAYTQCLHPWAEKTLEDLKSVKGDFFKAESFLDTLQERILQSVGEDPSDHTPYGPRMTEPLQIWTEKVEPNLLLSMRVLESNFEFALLKPFCCESCTAENLEKSNRDQSNPLPHPESSIGVGGKILPQRAIGPYLRTLEDEVRLKSGSEKDSD